MTDPRFAEQRELRNRIRQNVIQAIHTTRMSVDDALINAVVMAVAGDEKNYGKDEDTLSQLVFDECKKLASKPGRKRKRAGEITLRDMIPGSPQKT